MKHFDSSFHMCGGAAADTLAKAIYVQVTLPRPQRMVSMFLLMGVGIVSALIPFVI